MGRPPAVVIIVRHGARLDAADKQWHLTSPTPYDPPLTYGGWTQSRALGTRIASLLNAREELHQNETFAGSSHSLDAEEYNNVRGAHEDHITRRQSRRRRKKHNIIIHSSPFLRCVQTSVAIGAGLNQYHGDDQNTRTHSPSKTGSLHSGSLRRRGSEISHSPRLSAIPEPDEEGTSPSQKSRRKPRGVSKVRLRLDAFLGEWLSPDYYESITTPPDSIMMIASAKAELLLQESISSSEESTRSISIQGHFPGGWGNPWATVRDNAAVDLSGPLSTLPNLSQALPTRDRASSHVNTEISQSNHDRPLLQTVSKANSPALGYTAPVPNYALSPTDAIPAGYVAHARDACVEVDFHWDSMRPPHDWGHGGEYGEEWSSMHHRFRKGLQQMILWYCTNEEDATFGPDMHESEDVDTDTVIIVVTHGAGCNALIGALTNQPVLLDVGMASLTMATRKENSIGRSEITVPSVTLRRSSSIDYGMSAEYDMRLVASTDHLRSGSSVSSYRSQSLQTTFTHHPANHRSRIGSTASTMVYESPIDGGFKFPEAIFPGRSRRSSSIVTERSNSGLWTNPMLDSDQVTAGKLAATNGIENKPPQMVAENRTKPLITTNPDRKNSLGLWGAPPLEMINEREKGFKRRWTINER
ncbi:hypothetical protein MMC11_001237 [Xylographa trunciseda]|nr:hypothetical protein [Xylographa trunciseda]